MTTVHSSILAQDAAEEFPFDGTPEEQAKFMEPIAGRRIALVYRNQSPEDLLRRKKRNEEIDRLMDEYSDNLNALLGIAS